jgi:S-formylglutathione hydrolase FrmB
MWGDPVAQADIWKAHDPSDNAAALKGTPLNIANGNGQIGRLDKGSASPFDPDRSTEAEVATESAAFVHQLAALHSPVTVDAYGNGTHSWPYWQRDLHRSLAFLIKALGEQRTVGPA